MTGNIVRVLELLSMFMYLTFNYDVLSVLVSTRTKSIFFRVM
jgi:hypothetical protein